MPGLAMNSRIQRDGCLGHDDSGEGRIGAQGGAGAHRPKDVGGLRAMARITEVLPSDVQGRPDLEDETGARLFWASR